MTEIGTSNRVNAIRDILGPECGISSDMISGFCSESEEETSRHFKFKWIM